MQDRETPYHIFISYTRDPDVRCARELTSFLEAFDQIRAPAESGGEVQPELERLRVCLDGVTFSLPAADEEDRESGDHAGGTVTDVIEFYLGASRELLVLCSRKTRSSPWVVREIEWWLEHRGADTIRLAITEDPGKSLADFFPEPAVRHGLHDRIFYDFRGFRDPGSARGETFDLERVRLAADLNGRSAGDLLPLWLAEEASRMVAESAQIVRRDPSQALVLAHEANVRYPTRRTTDAVRNAYRVLTFRTENRREQAQITGRGAGYLAARWKEGQHYTVVSPDGAYTLLVTDRGESGSMPPGKVYLYDNDSLRTIELSAPESAGAGRRVEFVGFDNDREHVFVARQFYVAIYGLDGSWIGECNFSRFTKSPVHHVGGFLANRFVLGADGKGGLWMLDPSSDAAHEIHREWHGDALLDARIDARGSRAALVFESGRAVVLELPDAEGTPSMIALDADGVLFADFASGSGDVVLVAGREGLVNRIEIERHVTRTTMRYEAENRSFDWVWQSSDGTRLLVAARDHVVCVLDSESGAVLETYDFSTEIDWTAMRTLPGHRLPPEGETVHVGNREWLATKKGAYVRDNGRWVQVTVPFHPVRKILHVAESTWIQTGRGTGIFEDIGPTFRVKGCLAEPVPEPVGEVRDITEFAGQAYLRTDNGLWVWSQEGFERLPEIDEGVDAIKVLGEELWALGTGNAWRIHAGDVTSFEVGDLPVIVAFRHDDDVWLWTGRWPWSSEFGPMFRIRGSTVSPVPGPDRGVREYRVIGDELWLLEGSEKTYGPAHRWTGEGTDPVPDPDGSILGLYVSGGELWMAEYAPGKPIVMLRVRDGDVERFALDGVMVIDVDEASEAITVQTERGSFRFDGDGFRRVGGDTAP